MDTLTVNQRDKAEVIAVVQQIPAIFRQALKTIAVRESDGLYDGCAKVVEGSNTWDDSLENSTIMHTSMIATFSTIHTCSDSGRYRSAYCLMKSNLWSVRPVSCSRLLVMHKLTSLVREGRPIKENNDKFDPFAHRAIFSSVLDSVYVLACSFHRTDSGSDVRGVFTYLKAYVQKRSNFEARLWVNVTPLQSST
jgi:hypothetical protein